MSKTKSPKTKKTTKRIRDHKKERAKRIASILAGLPKPGDRINRSSDLERGLQMLKEGASQKGAAKTVGVSVEKLRLFRKLNTASERRGGRWIIFDNRPQPYWIATNGKMRAVTLPNDEGSGVGHYWSAVNEFLDTNDADNLDPYIGEGVWDVHDKLWIFETRPSVLRKLDSIGELHFIEIYADVAK